MENISFARYDADRNCIKSPYVFDQITISKYLIDLDNKLKDKYFSVKAIEEELVNDHDVMHLFKENRNKTVRTNRFFKQMFGREFLKPLWKTPYEFDEIFTSDASKRNDFLLKAKGSLEQDVIAKLGLSPDDLYVESAEYKPFNPKDSDHLTNKMN
jgi:hypothetical protein